jgi:4-aminobutyrate aminotransferase
MGSNAPIENSLSDALKSEGDVNISPQRRAWLAGHIGPETRRLLDQDARYFPINRSPPRA